LLLADSVHGRRTTSTTTLEEYAALIVQSDERGEWQLETASAAIVRRANYVRASYLDYTRHRFFETFREIMVHGPNQFSIVTDFTERRSIDIDALTAQFTRSAFFRLPKASPPTNMGPSTPPPPVDVLVPNKRRRSDAAAVTTSQSKSKWASFAARLLVDDGSGDGGDLPSTTAISPTCS